MPNWCSSRSKTISLPHKTASGSFRVSAAPPSVLTVGKVCAPPYHQGWIDWRPLRQAGFKVINPASDPVTPTATEGGPVSKASILLADDNPGMLDHVRRMLEKEDEYEVVAAVKDGPGVLREYTQHRPDVIILDISMGDLSGIDVATYLRNIGCESKIVFLTVHEDSDFVSAALGAGGSAYVVKSRLSADLIPAIQAALSDKLFVSASLLYEQG